MSLLHCACSKTHLSDSPPSAKPYDLWATPLSKTKVAVTLNFNVSSADEVVVMQLDSTASGYQLLTVIGKGHHDRATIYLANHIASGTQIAIKRIDLDSWDQEYNYIQNEIVLTKQLQHENILPHYCSFVHKHELWTVMPAMGYGSCRDLMHAYFSAGLPEVAILYILRDVLRALEYLHQRGIIHRGIKATHVLVSAEGRVCITGLHNAFNTIQSGQKMCNVYDYPTHAVDCLQWFSPEILEQNLAGYDTKSDVYSVGILACELANGQAPFTDIPVTQMLLEKLHGTKPMLADSETVGAFIIDDNSMEEVGEEGIAKTAEEKAQNIFFQRTFCTYLHEFVSLCLERNPVSRPAVADLLQHQCFKSLRRKAEEILPDCLQPVKPLKNITTFPNASAADDDITRQMSEVSMAEDWTF